MAVYYIGSYDIIDPSEFREAPADRPGASAEIWRRGAGVRYGGVGRRGDGAR